MHPPLLVGLLKGVPRGAALLRGLDPLVHLGVQQGAHIKVHDPDGAGNG